MIKWCRVAGYCLLLAWVAPGLTPHAQAEPVNRVVAVVNNEVITSYELNKKIKEATGFTPEDLMKRDERAFPEVRKQILELMINEKITEAKIRELNIKVSQKQIDESVENVKRENQLTQEQLRSRLQGEGLTWEKYLERMKM